MSSLSMSSFVSITALPEDVGFSTFLLHLFNHDMYTDVYFDLEHEGSHLSFSAHKFVLALRSPFFADEFYKKEKKLDNFIKLTNVDPEAFKAMLRYMYDYKPSIKTPKVACDLYKVAKEFQVFSLMNFCQGKLNIIKITLANVFDMLEASDYLQNKSLNDQCLKFIQENTKEVMASYEFNEISPSMISIFLRLREMSLDSVLDLFKWVFAWAESKTCKNPECGNHSECQTTREVLVKFLPQLPFVSLSDKQFAELYKCYKNVFDEDEVISMFMNLAISGSQKLPDWYNEECTVHVKSGSSE